MLIVYDIIPEVLEFDVSRQSLAGEAVRNQLCQLLGVHFRKHAESTSIDCTRPPQTARSSVVAVSSIGFFAHMSRRRWSNSKKSLAYQGHISSWLVPESRATVIKTGYHVFNAARGMHDFEFEILSVGGEKIIDPDILAGLPSNVSARRIDLTDEALAFAYCGAEALIFPSLYEGFGMPVIEAMACACPVITTGTVRWRKLPATQLSSFPVTTKGRCAARCGQCESASIGRS